MRLQEIYHICKNAQEFWPSLSFDEIKSPGNLIYYKVRNADAIRSIISNLEQIESFRETIAALKNWSYGFTQTIGDIVLDNKSKVALLTDYQRLCAKVITVTELFDSLNYRQDSDGFDIKLPAGMSLSDLSKCTKDLDTIFSTCPLFANQDVSIQFAAVDVGSVWLTFLAVGAAATVALNIVAELVDKALVIRSHYLTAREQEEKIRSLKLGNDVLENAVSINKEISKELLNKVSNELAEEHNISDPEDCGRLQNAVHLLSEWMKRGMEVYASIQAPAETKAVFPPIEKQVLPESIKGLLTDGNISENSQSQ